MKLTSPPLRVDALLIPLSVLVSLLVAAGAALALWITYEEIERKAARDAAAMVHLGEAYLTGELARWRFALEMTNSIDTPYLALRADQQAVLRAALTRDLGPTTAIILINDRGHAVASDDANTPLPDAVPDSFLAELRQAGRDLVLSPPLAVPDDPAASLILVGKRQETPSPLGYAVIVVPLERLRDLLRGIGRTLEEGGELGVLDAAGHLLVSLPERPSTASGSPASMPFPGVSGEGLERSYLSMAPRLSGGSGAREDRILTYERVPGTSWTLVVSQTTRSLLARWWLRVLIITSLVLLMCVAAMSLAFSLRRELRRRKQAEMRMTELAITDSLTGLANRRRFDDVIKLERDRALRAGTPLCLLSLDADHFKRINDSYGHAIGDDVLRLLGQVMQSELRRPGDFAARTGGEEFAAILADTGPDGAVHVAERIREEFARRTSRFFDGRDGCTLSVGVNWLEPKARESVTALLLGADDALYTAKKLGRDRVVVAEKSQSNAVADVDLRGRHMFPQGQIDRG